MAEKKAFENAFFRAAYDAAYIINCLHLAQENLPVKISSARLNSISGKWNKNFNSRKTIATSPARIWPNPISNIVVNNPSGKNSEKANPKNAHT